MKRSLLLLSSTLLLINSPALAVDSSKVMAVPPPPKETTPGNVQFYGRESEYNAPTDTPAPVKAKAGSGPKLTVLGKGGPYTAKAAKVQRFADYLNINQGLDSAPLTMTLTNDGFEWFRVLIANQLIATEKSLNGKTTGDIDLTGVVGTGNNQIVVEAGGVAGSNFSWKVTTLIAPKLDKADPDEGVGGDTIVKLSGKNFSSRSSEVAVTFNDKGAQVISSKSTELQIKIPKNADLGDNKVVASVRGVKSNALKIKVRAIPSVTGTSLASAPPGTQLTIYGNNFSKVLSENKVFIGDRPANILSGSTTTLLVIVPDLPTLDWVDPMSLGATGNGLPVKVQVGKLISKETVNFVLGRQMAPSIQNGQYKIGPGTDNPAFPPGQGPTYGAPQPDLSN